MKKLSLLLLLFAFVFTGCSSDDDDNNIKPTLVIDFEGKLTEPNSEFTTDEGKEIGEDYFESSFKDPSNTLEFSHYYGNWGFGGGFTYTNKTDVTTPGYTNISAITGKGKFGSTYLTSTTTNLPKITMLKPEKYTFKELWVTNSTYAYLAIKDGNDGYLGETKFGSEDWFLLKITAYDENNKARNTMSYFLADYKSAKTDIVNTWERIDLALVADAAYLTFELSSTDNGEWGMNTPSYFCIDGITLEEK